MILQALTRYYQRLLDEEGSGVAPPGFGEAKISFALVLDDQGKLVDVQDLRDREGKKTRPRQEQAPQAVTRTVGISANFLWDNTGYVLGADNKDNPERAAQCFAAFKELQHQLGKGIDDPGVRSVLRFLDAWDPRQAAELPQWEEMAGQNLVFRLDGQRGFVHQSPAARQAWLEHWSQQEAGEPGQCLVSGERLPLSRLHPAIKGVWGAQSSGARLVSFNLDAFTSYGKEQNYNAPVGNRPAFAYTTALNRLLAKGGRQRIQIGDASVVFWSEAPSEAEEILGFALNGGEAEDQALNQRIAAFLQAAKNGQPLAGWQDQEDNPFYILGLSPNASRLSVRFWHMSTVGEMQRRLGQHLADLELARISDKQPEHPPLWMLLKQCAAQGKTENIPPLLAGEMTRAVLTGRPYPNILLAALVERIRADKQVGYLRAALLKAYLTRQYRLNQTNRADSGGMEVTVTLDTQSTNPAYRLGRMFAVLEDLQRNALPGIKATIRDKYLSSASSAPRASFPYLLRNAQNHYSKLRKQEGKEGLAGFFDQLIGEISQGLNAQDGFPATLDMEQQGLFFLGYYQQKAHRPNKQDADDNDSAAAADETLED